MTGAGPGALGALCLTFDNLGEAAELGSGDWPPDAPVGDHFTVAVVRRLLDVLDRHGVRATFFVEAFNAEVYPELLRELAARGHEVACHAWQHERWSALGEDEERALLERCTRALRGLGLPSAGFRPPGGQGTARTARLLAEQGYRYWSPAGSRAGVAGGLAVLPFAWRLVDGYYAAPALAGLRAADGLGAEPQPEGVLEAGMAGALRANAAAGLPTTAVFHPMLLDDPAAVAALERVLDTARAAGIPCRPAGETAERMLIAGDGLGGPVVDATTWAPPR